MKLAKSIDFRVSAKFSSAADDVNSQSDGAASGGGSAATAEEAAAIRTELLNIQRSLTSGEREKAELMKSLACLKDDLTRLQHSESSLDVSSALGATAETASQTDLSSTLSSESIPVGARLAEMARLRLQYDEARRQVQDVQQVKFTAAAFRKLFIGRRLR